MQVQICLFWILKRLYSDSYCTVRIAHGLNSFYGSTCHQKVAVEVRCNVNVDDAMAAVWAAIWLEGTPFSKWPPGSTWLLVVRRWWWWCHADAGAGVSVTICFADGMSKVSMRGCATGGNLGALGTFSMVLAMQFLSSRLVTASAKVSSKDVILRPRSSTFLLENSSGSFLGWDSSLHLQMLQKHHTDANVGY